MSQTIGIGTKGTKFDKLISEGSILTELLSYEKKKANNFKWCEESADYIDSLNSPLRDEERLKRFRVNYDLANGRGDSLLEMQSQFTPQKIEEEIISSGTTPVRHLPIINQIYDAMVGAQMQAAIKFTAIDTSGYSTTMRQKKRLELNQQWLQENIISPIEQQVAMQVMMENGITQQTQLDPDQQQDLQADVQNRMKFRLVDDIDKFMAKDYKTPPETEVQKLVNYLFKACDFKYVTDENFKNVIIIGGEVYRIIIRNGFPKLEIVNLAGFWFQSARNKLFVDEADIIKYEQSPTIADILTWHGTELYKGKYKDKLMDLRKNFNIKHKELDNIVSFPGHDQIMKAHPPINTPEGQRYARALMTIFGGSSSEGMDYCHYVWKSFGKLKAIKRKTEIGVQIFYVDENYEFNPLKKDIEESIEIVPEIYQTSKIGNDIYVDKGPLPYQYRSRQNPFEVRMNYVGAMYNTLGGNSQNVSPIDLGKPWQHKINVQAAKIEDADRKNLGNVLAFPRKGRPSNTTWSQWMSLLKNEGILLHDDSSEGLTASDLQAIRAIQVGSTSEIEARIPYLEFLRNQMSLSMGFNPSRLGNQDPNLSVTNNRQNIVQSTIQTEHIYRTHNKVIENVMNNLVNTAKITLRDNPIKASYVLDDMSVAELNLDFDLLDTAEQNIYVNNSMEDQKTLERINMLAQPYIQNGIIDLEDSIMLELAKNPGDLLNTAKESTRKNEARMQQKMEMDKQMAEQQNQLAQQLEQMRQEMELEKQRRDLETRLLVAQIDSQKFANQFDIDKSGLNDQYEQKLIDLEFQREELTKKLEERDKDRAQEKVLKLKELEVKRKQIMSRPKSKT